MSRVVKITGTHFADVLVGSGRSEKIKAKRGADGIDGGAGNDKINGGSGDDRIAGGAGNDTIDGGKGIDTAVYRGLFAEYVLSLPGGGDTVVVSDGAPNRDGVDTLRKVEFVLFRDAIYDVERDVVFVLNRAPVVANPLADAVTQEDEGFSVTLAANAFSDADNDALTLDATLADGSALPSWLEFNALTRTFTGTPPQDFNGFLDIRVTASDGEAAASDVFRLLVAPVNDAPVADADTVDATEDTAVVYTAAQLLANDSDAENGALRIGSVTSGAGGIAVLNADGTVTFTPAENFNGAAGFSYTASDDGGLASNSAAVAVNVAPVNDAPTVAVSPFAVTIEESEDPQTITPMMLLSAIGAADIDGDALSIVNFRVFGPDGELDPDNLPPSVTLTFGADGSLASFGYDPSDFSHLAPQETETVTLEFDVSDGRGGIVHDTALLTFLGVPTINTPAIIGEPPFREVKEDRNVVAGDIRLSGFIPISDADPNQSSFSTAVVPAAGNKGILSLQPNGAYTYIVQNGAIQYLGVNDMKVDAFTISSVDGTTRQVDFTILGVNDRVVIPHQPANPSFEQIGAAVPFGGTLSLAGGSTIVNAWTVIGAGIDFVRNGYQGSLASDGTAYIDLAGSTPAGSYAGGVRQVVGTIPGSRYFVQFDLSGNPDGGAVETLRVSAGADVQDYAFDTTGRTWTDLGWREEQFIFTASGPSTPLSFVSLTGDFMGPLLDNVRLTPIVRLEETLGTPAGPANGSLEQTGAPVPAGGTLSLAGGSLVLTDWTVTGAGIDFVRSGYQGSQAADGDAYIDLAGSTFSGSYAGGVRQVLETVPGTRYAVQFAMSGNPDGASIETIRVSAGSEVKDYSFDTAGRSWTNLGWRQEQFFFTATSPTTALSFESRTGDFMGPLLDNVRVSLTTGGTVGFLDADFSDDGDHSVGSTFVGDPLSQLGSLSAFETSDTTNGGGGVVRWDYAVDPRAIEFLAAGERHIEKFMLTIGDGNFGGDASQYVLVDLVGTNDDPTVGSGTFEIDLEAPFGIPGEPLEITRTFSFSDVDVTDLHSAAAVFDAARSSSATPIGIATAEVISDTVNGTGGIVRWNYAIAPEVSNTLTPGDIFTDAFNIVVADGAGGTATARVMVTISDTIASLTLEPPGTAFV